MRIKWIVGQKFFGPLGIYFGNISAQKWFVYKKKTFWASICNEFFMVNSLESSIYVMKSHRNKWIVSCLRQHYYSISFPFSVLCHGTSRGKIMIMNDLWKMENKFLVIKLVFVGIENLWFENCIYWIAYLWRLLSYWDPLN